MSSASQSISDSIAQESQSKRRRIAHSLWPRARLVAEILYREIDRDRLFTQASALTYKTLFSLLPIFVLSLLILSTISTGGGKNALDAAVKQMLFEQLGIDKIPITDENGRPMIDPVTHQEVTLRSFTEKIIDKAQQSVTTPATGLVAFAVLLYGAITLMIVIESTFNQIYGAIKPRSWPRRIMLYWCVLTLGPIGVSVSIVLGRSAYSTASSHVGAGWFLSAANVITGFAVSWLLVLLLFKLIPDTRVNWRPAALGSFLAALAWEIGKWAMGLYVNRALRNSWYGSIALLPLFMLWIYMTWSVVLLGLEFTYLQQYWPMLKRRFFFTRGAGKGMVMLSDIRWVLPLGALLYKRFQAGKAITVEEAADLLMLPNDVTGELLLCLEQAGLVHSLGARSGGYTLARPAESITAHDLLSAARSISQVPPEIVKSAASDSHVRTFAQSAAVRELEEVEAAWARTRTLAQLAS